MRKIMKSKYKVIRYTNPSTFKGIKIVRMRLHGWSLYTTVENIDIRPSVIAKKWAEALEVNVTYRPIRGTFNTKDVEIWIKN